jgi:hypothetical protein
MVKKYLQLEKMPYIEQEQIIKEGLWALQEKFPELDDIYFGTTHIQNQLKSRMISVSTPHIRDILDGLVTRGGVHHVLFYNKNEEWGYTKLYRLLSTPK